MNIRFMNARVMSMQNSCNVQEHQEIWVKGNRIAAIGSYESHDELRIRMQECGILPRGFDRTIDCDGDLLMPGFKNAHAHSAMVLFRSIAEDMPLDRWLQEQIFPREALLTPEDIGVLTKLAVMEYVSGGITAVFDMYLTPDTIAQAFIECGMRVVQCGTVNNFTHSVQELEEYYLRHNGQHELSSYQLGFHAEYTTSREILEGIAKLSRKYQTPVYMHLSETEKEVQDCTSRYGMTPPAFLDSLGMFDYGGGGYHCVCLTEADMELMKKRNVAVITNPGSNTKLASGIAPVYNLWKQGITIAIGTDGAASNNALDFFREMYLAAGLAKLREHDAACIPAEEVLRMATVNGAQVMGLKDCSTLEAGQKADLIRIDLKQPNMQPSYHIPRNLVYSGNKSNVSLTMVNGKILYENGVYHIGVKPDGLYCQVRRIAETMTASSGQK